MRYLLDANVLIARTVPDHVHHDRCRFWLRGVDHIAACPITEGALARYLVNTGTSAAQAVAVIHSLAKMPAYEFWPDTLSYGDADLRRVTGYKQVTDAYLANLVQTHRDSQLATLDEGLATLYPDDVLLIPELPSTPS